MPAQVLLVEGPDDKHVIKNLCASHGVCGNLDIKHGDPGGFEWVLDDFPVRLKLPGLTALGLVLDADENVQDRWNAVRDRLRRIGYIGVPDVPDLTGFVAPKQD